MVCGSQGSLDGTGTGTSALLNGSVVGCGSWWGLPTAACRLAMMLKSARLRGTSYTEKRFDGSSVSRLAGINISSFFFCQGWMENMAVWNHALELFEQQSRIPKPKLHSSEMTKEPTATPLMGREFWNQPSPGWVPPPLHSQTAAHGTPPHRAVEWFHQAAKFILTFSVPWSLLERKSNLTKHKKAPSPRSLSDIEQG